MNAVTEIDRIVTDDELTKVLSNSLYPGAKSASVALVLSYCRAAKLDPMLKPVHIVPMNVKVGWNDGRGVYEYRDIIMPGIGLYRITAARTGEHVGTDKPIFGPMVTQNLGGQDVAFPEWCEITVRRRKGSTIALYTVQEFWLENYASKSRDTYEPNEMWTRRAWGQIAKCAEAQALRRGFPEVGSQPTAEEMEGKTIDLDEIQPARGKPDVATPQALTNQPSETLEQPLQGAEREAATLPEGDRPIKNPTPNKDPAPVKDRPQADASKASSGEINYIKKKLESKKMAIPDALAAAGLDRADTLDGLTRDGFVALKDLVTK